MKLVDSLNLQSSVYNATNGAGGSGRDGVSNSVPSYPSEINPGVSHNSVPSYPSEINPGVSQNSVPSYPSEINPGRSHTE